MKLYVLLSLALFGQDVERMGSDDFASREAASRHCLVGGWLSRPALERGLRSSDPERRRRCREALQESKRLQEAWQKPWRLYCQADALLQNKQRLGYITEEEGRQIEEGGPGLHCLLVKLARQRGSCGERK